MKGKISSEGYLELQRGTRMKMACCPFCHANEWHYPHCGDWCPQFGEPVEDADGTTTLILCQDAEWDFDEFTDERE